MEQSKTGRLLLAALMGMVAASASAAVVTFDMTINGSATPAPILVGETVTIEIYVHVTDNTQIYNGTPRDLGLGLYRIDLDGGSVLSPSVGDSLGRWNAMPGIFMGNFDPGVISGNRVLGIADGTGVPSTFNSSYATSRTLLLTGSFEAVAEGTVTLGAITPLSTVFTVKDGSLGYKPPETIQWKPVPTLSVVPEPSVMMLGSAVAMSALSRRKRNRH